MASPTSAHAMPTTLMRDLSLAIDSESSSSELSESENEHDAHPTSTDNFDLDAKPPLITANSAPPVLQHDYEIKEDFSFGTCPSISDLVGTPVAEMGQFEYPENAGSSSRRSSLFHPSLRRGSSTSSTVSTITALSSTTTRRPSLAPVATYPPGPLVNDANLGRRRGSMFHFQTKPVSGPIPPSLLARRGSLPAAEAIFGLPSSERKPFNRVSLSAAPPMPQSPSTSPIDHNDPSHSPSNRRPSFKLRLPPALAARRGSLPATAPLFPSPTLPSTSEIEPPSQPYNRQSASTNSSRGSLLSQSSLLSEEVIRDDGDSTDQDTGAEVDTPGSSSETEAMGLFSDPWRSTTPTVTRKEGEGENVAQRQAVVQ